MNAILRSEDAEQSAAGQPAWMTGQQDTLCDVLRRAARQHGDKPFLDFLGEVHSFADIDRHACRLANGLRTLGVRKGETVVTLLDNSADALFILFAITKLGAISVPVNTAYKGDFLRHQLSDSGAAVVIAESDYAERVAAVADGLPELKTLVHRGAQPALPDRDWRVMSWAALYSDDATDPAEDVRPGDLAMLIYTGGTTGPSKGCMVSHNYACNQARQMLQITQRTADTITWTPLPLFHMNAVATSVVANMMIGARVALYTRFSVSNFWPEIERTKATDVGLLASMLPLLAQAADNDAMKRCYGQLTACFGAPFPTSVQQVWQERFGVKHTVSGGFGLTECAIMTLRTRDTVAPPTSSGRRFEDFDVRIVDEHDNELPPNTPGEIIVRPRKPHIMFEGYWRRAEDTMKVMQNLWFHTGDIGMFDDDDFFYFLDRKKDYLRRRGENISSFEVENAFRNHPALEELAAHAVLSSLGEDELKITAVLREGATVTEEELFVWSTDQLPYFAVPRYIEFRDKLPRNPVGRILKYQLRDEGVTPGTWDQEKSGIKIAKR